VKTKTCVEWTGLPAGFTPVGLAGFIYRITHVLSDRSYIGRKYFYAKNRRKVKGKKRRKLVVSESDWRYYTGSSDDLNAEIQKYGKDSFRFEILEVFKTRAQVNYAETKALFLNDVLYSRLPTGEYKYYNSNILGRYYRSKHESDSA